AGFFYGFGHLLCFSSVSPQRLFAKHRFAGLRSRDRNFGMSIVGARDVDDIDIAPLDHFTPIRFDRFVAPLLTKRFGASAIAAAYGLQHRRRGDVEKVAYLPKSIRMGTAHEAVAHQPYVEFLLFTHSCSIPDPLSLTPIHAHRGRRSSRAKYHARFRDLSWWHWETCSRPNRYVGRRA